MKKVLPVLTGFLMCAVFPAVTPAQPLWVTQDHNKLLALEILKPGFDSAYGTGFTTLSFFFTTRLPLSPQISFVGEIPVSHYDVDETPFLESETTIGNIYLGIEQNAEGGFGEFGIRIPTMSEEKGSAQNVGLFSDLDRWEGWLRNAWAVEGYGNFRYVDAGGIGGRGRLGASMWVPTKRGDVEVWIPYTVMGFFQGSGGELAFGLTGRGLITQSGSFDQRTLHQLVLAGHLNVGQVQLGAQYRHWLDSTVNDDVNYVFGLTAGVALK